MSKDELTTKLLEIGYVLTKENTYQYIFSNDEFIEVTIEDDYYDVEQFTKVALGTYNSYLLAHINFDNSTKNRRHE